jgi:hypothetical protein
MSASLRGEVTSGRYSISNKKIQNANIPCQSRKLWEMVSGYKKTVCGTI